MTDPLPYGEKHRWSRSDRLVPRTIVRPLQRFMEEETAGGIIMLIAAVVALLWANSPWWESYASLLDTEVVIAFGDVLVLDEMNAKEWVNEGLMTVFFLLMAMEIKREALYGELQDRRKAAVPVIAAVGGMVVPAVIYLSFNAGTDFVDGWGIPMATDIAFAVAVVSLLGRRLPPVAKVFVLTLAIVDDVGAILVIALVYTSDLDLSWLLAALVGVLALLVVNRIGIRSMTVIILLGLFVWFAMLQSGVEATLAGVIVGLLVPSRPFYSPAHFAVTAQPMVDRLQDSLADGMVTTAEAGENEATMSELIHLSRESVSPLQRLAYVLEPWVAFVIVPIFALMNAGVRVVDGSGEWETTVIAGVGLGLLVGKPLGVFGATWLAVRAGLGRLPSGTTWGHIFGLAVVTGIGFTVALFVAELALESGPAVDSAKVGILAASTLAGVLGWATLRIASRAPQALDPELRGQPDESPASSDQPVPTGS